MFWNQIQLNTVLRLIFVQLCIKQVAKTITLFALAERFSHSVTAMYVTPVLAMHKVKKTKQNTHTHTHHPIPYKSSSQVRKTCLPNLLAIV